MRLIKIMTLCLLSIMHIAAYAQEIPNDEIWYTASSMLPQTTNGGSSCLHINAFNTTILSHTFRGGKGVIKFNGDVTSIGEYAFYGCKGLTSVTIPNSVTSIGRDAFYDCSSLPVVDNLRYADTYLVGVADKTLSIYTIKEGTKWIGDYAFSRCSGLTSVTIPNSVTSIGHDAFYGCKGLTSVTIPNSVTSIGESAFYGCSSLTSINIPDSVTSIGSRAFYECISLTSVTIPNSVTSIGYDTFFRCSGLISVDIPDSVTSIGSRAFYECRSLTSVSIPNSVTSIGYGAFYDCGSLTSVSIPNSVTSIGSNTFFRCSGLISITIPNSVTSIGEEAFYGCSGLTSINIPNSVTSIGYEAFYGCSGLTSINIPDSVTSIGKEAFWGCYGLTSSIYIPSSVTSIGSAAFGGCSNIETITVSKENTCFSDYDNNVIVNLDTHELISGCNKSTIPDSVTSIGNYAFDGCSGLTSITIPNSVTSIGGYAFRDCSGLTSITIPNSVTSIGFEAFYYCSGLTSLTIPSSVTSIGGYAFYGCSKVKELIYSEGATKVFNLGILQNLTSVTLPNTIKTIEASAFYYCIYLKSIDIPKSVTSIGADAFRYVLFLREIHVHWDEPLAVPASIFRDVSTSSATLYVPCIEPYKSAAVWKNFGTITFDGDDPYDLTAINKDGYDVKMDIDADDDVTINDTYKSLSASKDVSDVNITYSRTFKNANWQPLYVPFDMTVTSDLLQRFSFAKFAGTYTEEDNAGNVSFFITIVRLREGDEITANTPYFIQAKTADASNAQTISVDGTTLHKTEEMNFSMYSAEKKLSVYGIYNQKICAYDGEYYAYSAGKYSKQLTGAKLGAFRFYVTIEDRADSPYKKSKPAEIKLKVVGEDVTGISDVGPKLVEGDGAMFNLAGQVVAPDYKGIVIKNGKKMYNK